MVTEVKMYEFHITGFAECNDPYFYDSDATVDITVRAYTKSDAIEKAESILEHGIHKDTMKIVIKEL